MMQPEPRPVPPRVPPNYRLVSANRADSDYIRALDDQDLELRCPLDNGRHDITTAVKNEDLGTLSLPPELVWLILKHLDIPSVTTFRRVSKKAMHMVDTTFEYQDIMNRAPQVIRGALTLEANCFTLSDAHITLSDGACTTCGKIAGYIYLMTCERVCSQCLTDVFRWRPRLVPLSHVGMGRYGGGQPGPHRRLQPSAMARPGTYGTTAGYKRPCVRSRIWHNRLVQKTSSSRFWDAKHSLYQVQGYGDHGYHPGHKRCGVFCQFGYSWLASAFFVSVKVPLVELERFDSDESD